MFNHVRPFIIVHQSILLHQKVCRKCVGYKSLFCVISCCFIHFSAFMAFGLASPWPLFFSESPVWHSRPFFGHGVPGAMSIAICRARCRCGAKAPQKITKWERDAKGNLMITNINQLIFGMAHPEHALIAQVAQANRARRRRRPRCSVHREFTI